MERQVRNSCSLDQSQSLYERLNKVLEENRTGDKVIRVKEPQLADCVHPVLAMGLLQPKAREISSNYRQDTHEEGKRMTPWILLPLILLAGDGDFKPDQSKLPATPPKDAIVLLDVKGKHSFLSMAGEKINWPIEDGALVSTPKGNKNHIVSQLHFRDADIHVEFMLPEKGPGNSGVYIHGNYEVQILNSFGKEKPTQDDAGAVYGFAKPLVNACRKPGEWQVFDIRYRAPRRDESGKIVEMGTVTVWFNGKKVQDGAKFGEPKSTFHPFRFGTTPYLEKIRDRQKKTMTGPVFLQDHNNAVKFRNVWVRPADDHAFVYEPDGK